MHYACQKQCHVCLGSHLTKPCLSCVVTSKTAAIHVRCQHSMCNFLSCKILQGPHPTAWDQEGLPFSLPDAYWSIKESHTPFTMHHPMHLPTKCTIHLHAMHLSTTYSLVPRLFFLEQDYNAPSIYIYMPCTPYRVTYMLDLSFSTQYGLAKLQIVYVENNIQPHCLGNIQECCSSLTSAVVLVS